MVTKTEQFWNYRTGVMKEKQYKEIILEVSKNTVETS